MIILLGGCGDDNGPTAPTNDPVAAFSYSGDTVTPATIIFQNQSENADGFLWDFGDGRTSIQENPRITYEQHGSYTVTLVATNTSTSKSNTASRDLTITPGIVFLDSIIIEQIPFTDEAGAGWDLFSGPDLFFHFTNSAGDILLYGYTRDDLSPSDLPLRYWTDSPYRISNWTTTYDFDLYDWDNLSVSDYMGTVSFRINQVIADQGYSEELTIRNQTQTIRLRLVLHWE